MPTTTPDDDVQESSIEIASARSNLTVLFFDQLSFGELHSIPGDQSYSLGPRSLANGPSLTQF